MRQILIGISLLVLLFNTAHAADNPDYVCPQDGCIVIPPIPTHTITSQDGNVEIGVIRRYGGAIGYYKDARIPDSTVAKGNIIDYSNTGTLFTTPLWTLPEDHDELRFCYDSQLVNGPWGPQCSGALPFNNPTQGGIAGCAGNPNPTTVSVSNNRISVSTRLVNWNFAYNPNHQGTDPRPFCPEWTNADEWQTDIWQDIEIYFHPVVSDVAVIETKVTYCKDMNDGCKNRNLVTQGSQLATFFAAGNKHPDTTFMGPYTKVAYLKSDGVYEYASKPGPGIGISEPLGHAIPHENWIALLQDSNRGIGISVEGYEPVDKTRFGYSMGSWPSVIANQPRLDNFQTYKVTGSDVVEVDGRIFENLWRYEFEPGGWYKFTTYTATGTLSQIRNKFLQAGIITSCNPDRTNTSGLCDIRCGSSSECSGHEPGDPVGSCTSHATKTYHNDKCDSSCQNADRNSLCLKTGYADCTGDPECHFVTAGTNGCSSECVYAGIPGPLSDLALDAGSTNVINFDFSHGVESAAERDVTLRGSEACGSSNWIYDAGSNYASKITKIEGEWVQDVTLSDCMDSGLYDVPNSFSYCVDELKNTFCVLTREDDVVRIGSVQQTGDIVLFRWGYLSGGPACNPDHTNADGVCDAGCDADPACDGQSPGTGDCDSDCQAVSAAECVDTDPDQNYFIKGTCTDTNPNYCPGPDGCDDLCSNGYIYDFFCKLKDVGWVCVSSGDSCPSGYVCSGGGICVDEGNPEMCRDFFLSSEYNGRWSVAWNPDPSDCTQCAGSDYCVVDGTCYATTTKVDYSGNLANYPGINGMDMIVECDPAPTGKWYDYDGGQAECETGGLDWIEPGENGVGEYGSSSDGGPAWLTPTECCGDDDGEHAIASGGMARCCDSPDDYLDFAGNCMDTSADVNNDGAVDILDLNLVTGIFGSIENDPEWDEAMDVIGDGEIDIFDVVFVAGRFMNTAPAEDFTVVVLPDTQYYSYLYPDPFTSQTQWIVDNKDNMNIKFVVHLGDLVHHGDDTSEWEHADESISILDGEVPYLVVPGNHDYDNLCGSGGKLTTNYNTYFPYTRFNNYAWHGGNYPYGKNDNSYGFFSASGQDFLVIGLEFCPSNEALTWADNLIAGNPADKKVILFTHLYMYSDNTRVDPDDSWSCDKYACCSDGNCNDGEDMWTNLVQKHSNIVLVLSGHILNDGQGRRTDNVDGHPVNQILQNYQMLANGGDGWLRYYTFKPDENKIEAFTYSPYRQEYDTSPSNRFDLNYETYIE